MQDAAGRMEEALETAIARSRGLTKAHRQRSDLLRAFDRTRSDSSDFFIFGAGCFGPRPECVDSQGE